MAIKTFNIDEEVYKRYSEHCRENGISMSKQVERFIANEVARIERTAHPPSPSTPTVHAQPARSSLKDEHAMRKFC